MGRLRLIAATFFGWFFLFYNIERLHAPLNLASFVYVAASAAALALLLLPSLQRVALGWLLLAIVPIHLVIKAWLGYPLAGAALPLTVTELCALGLSVTLARLFGQAIEEFRTAVQRNMLHTLGGCSQAFDTGQSEIFREIRRARLHHRPLVMMAITPTEESTNAAVDRLISEVQQETMRTYLDASIADLLSSEMHDCDTLTQRGDHFITLLPETSRDEARVVAQRLTEVAKERLGVDLQVGVSAFPDDEVTFVRLLECAEAEMLNGQIDESATSTWSTESVDSPDVEAELRRVPR